jgi:glycosyltransferase involved in cell wall biosynthesis
VDHALDASRLLAQAGVDVRLTVVGTGEVEPRLRRAAADGGLADRVTFTGQVTEEEKNRCLRNAHLLVHTSVREGWGLNVIEANAMGTPAIVYPVHGLVDSTVDGQTGLVAKEETPSSVVAAVQELLRTPQRYEELRFQAWERSKSFQWQNVLPPACDWLEAQARGKGSAT